MLQVTSPKGMSSNDYNLEKLIDKFEKSLLSQEKDLKFYRIIFRDEDNYSRKDFDKIQDLYIAFGWRKAVCITCGDKCRSLVLELTR